MLSHLDKGWKTIQNDGLKVFLIRMKDFSIVKLKRAFRPRDKKNILKWQGIKDEYKGKRIFLIGNGPSLNRMPLYLLKDEYTMCFNRFNLMFERLNFIPDFYVVVDDLVIRDNYKEMNREILPVMKYAFFPDIHPSNLEVTNYIDNRDNVFWYNADKPAFSIDLPKCGINKTVVNAGLQIAAHMGFTEIYLIGVDMTFSDQHVKKITSRNWEAKEDDPNHFDPRYFQKGKKYHNPTVHEMIEKFETAKKFFDKLGVKIYNAGMGGKLEVFPRVEFTSLFIADKQKTEQALDAYSALKKSNISFKYIQEQAKELNGTAFPPLFKTSLEKGAALMPGLIQQYIPIGPFEDTYYFIQRDHLILNNGKK